MTLEYYQDWAGNLWFSVDSDEMIVDSDEKIVKQGKSVTKEVVDRFTQKLITSGYSTIQTRRITMNGIKGWEGKKRRLLKEGKRLFRPPRRAYQEE